MPRGSDFDVAREVALERAEEALLEGWLNKKAEVAGPDVTLKFQWLCRHHPNEIRFITGVVVSGVELGTGLIPLPDKVRSGGEEALKHLPIVIERWGVKHLPSDLPEGFQPPALTSAPVITWRFFRPGETVPSLDLVRKVFRQIFASFGSETMRRIGETFNGGLNNTLADVDAYRRTRADREAARKQARIRKVLWVIALFRGPVYRALRWCAVSIFTLVRKGVSRVRRQGHV